MGCAGLDRNFCRTQHGQVNRRQIVIAVFSSAMVLSLLGSILLPHSSNVCPQPIDYFGPLKQLGLALNLYSGDNIGFLPGKAEAVVPDYIPVPRLAHDIRFLAPGRRLADLPPHAIIAQQKFRNDGMIAFLHANMSVEVVKL